jgi:hypothetical protein
MPRGYPRGRDAAIRPKKRYWGPAEKAKTAAYLKYYFHIANKAGMPHHHALLWAVKQARKSGHYIPYGIYLANVAHWMRHGRPAAQGPNWPGTLDIAPANLMEYYGGDY